VDGVLYAVDEWRVEPSDTGARLTNVEQSKELREWLNNGQHHPRMNRHHGHVFVDTAAADFRVQLARDGLRNRPASKEVQHGIRLIASLLATDRLKISDRCHGLIKEFPAYRWDPKATDSGKDEVIKANDHSLDGL